MARIRTIKPEFWTSEQVMECEPVTRLLFIGLWNFCDDYGNHPASPKTIKALVFPGDDFSPAIIDRMLEELSTNRLIAFYEHSGKRYLHVRGWKHQKIDKPSRKHPAFVEPESGEDQEGDTGGTGDTDAELFAIEGEEATPEKGVAPKHKAAKFDPLTARPANVTEKAWADWCQHRREIRKPLTAKACEQQAKALEGHHSPDEVLRQSIGNGWTGIFPERVEYRATSRPALRVVNGPDFHSDDTSWANDLGPL